VGGREGDGGGGSGGNAWGGAGKKKRSDGAIIINQYFTAKCKNIDRLMNFPTALIFGCKQPFLAGDPEQLPFFRLHWYTLRTHSINKTMILSTRLPQHIQWLETTTIYLKSKNSWSWQCPCEE